MPARVANHRRADSTFADAFDPRSNSLNALRLLLATSVIVWHSWPVGGYHVATEGLAGIGQFAVAGFFGISGFLITMSRARSHSLRDYLWRRVLRIYPGFLVVQLLTAFVIAPFTVVVFDSGHWRAIEATKYLVKDIALYMRQYTIPGTLHGVPYPQAWNGALYTLSYEFLCYIGIGLVISLLPAKAWQSAALALVLLTVVNVLVVSGHLSGHPFITYTARFGAPFAAGSLIYLFRDRVPVHWALGLGSAAALVVIGLTGTFFILGGPPIAYLMMWLGVRSPFTSIGSRNDVSYGMYIYGFPLQQVLQLALRHHRVPLPVFMLISVALTVPFAFASWLLVERPMMRLKRLTAKAATDREGHVAASG